MTKPLVLYVAPFSFPEGGAAARRIYGNCLSIKSAGYDVAVASAQVGDVESSYNGIKIFNYCERKHENLPRFLKHFFYFNAGTKLIDLLNSMDVKPYAVVLYSGYSPYLMRLRRWCTKHSVKLIFDAVEWYDSPAFPANLFSPYHLNIELAMRCLLEKCDGLVVISSYLESFYKNKVENLAKVPPTLNTADIVTRVKDDISSVTTSFVYAGTPGKKDSIDLIVKAIYELYNSGYKVQLDLVGITYKQLFRYSSLSDINKDILECCVNCHGYLDHKSSIDVVVCSDYSVIVRPNIKSVQAGFPTKFVESLAVGTPVIANITSDLGQYLEDKSNGFVINSIEVEDIKSTFLKAINSCGADREQMRINARNTAVNNFDIGRFSSQFKKILS